MLNELDEEEDGMDYREEGEVEDRSIRSLNETLNVKTCSCITNFMLVCWIEDEDINPGKYDNGDEEFKIQEEWVLALIEIKLSASWGLKEQRLKHEEDNLMRHAQEGCF